MLRIGYAGIAARSETSRALVRSATYVEPPSELPLEGAW
jgi:hypothetical protein